MYKDLQLCCEREKEVVRVMHVDCTTPAYWSNVLCATLQRSLLSSSKITENSNLCLMLGKDSAEALMITKDYCSERYLNYLMSQLSL
jgi:hypothetical protein